MTNIDLFSTPIRQKKVRKNVYANKYRNGIININGEKYAMYSMTEATRKWRHDHPLTPNL